MINSCALLYPFIQLARGFLRPIHDFFANIPWTKIDAKFSLYTKQLSLVCIFNIFILILDFCLQIRPFLSWARERPAFGSVARTAGCPPARRTPRRPGPERWCWEQEGRSQAAGRDSQPVARKRERTQWGLEVGPGGVGNLGTPPRLPDTGATGVGQCINFRPRPLREPRLPRGPLSPVSSHDAPKISRPAPQNRELDPRSTEP